MRKRKNIYPKEFLTHIQSITNKRAKIVIDHILQHGFITTEDLEVTYGYNHPPRAVRDVREAGIPLETFKVKSKEGKSIAAYRFGDIAQLNINRRAGRKTLSKAIKTNLFELCAGKCAVCNGEFAERYLQIDHRVPYEVCGDIADNVNDNFMLLCGSCNRAKSWSCEHCDNWHGDKNIAVCKNCYWGNPFNYSHIALKDVRRLDIQWDGTEVADYDDIKEASDNQKIELPNFVKNILKNYIHDSNG